jgi:hypothetical protein
MIVDPPPGNRVPMTRYGDLLRCKSDRQRNWMHRWLNKFRAEKPRSRGTRKNYESQQDERNTLDSRSAHWRLQPTANSLHPTNRCPAVTGCLWRHPMSFADNVCASIHLDRPSFDVELETVFKPQTFEARADARFRCISSKQRSLLLAHRRP